MNDLKLLAEKATQGKWTAFIGASNTNEVQLNGNPRYPIVSWPGFDGLRMSKKQVKANTRYIAAANPKVIIDLITRIEKLEAEKEGLIIAARNQ